MATAISAVVEDFDPFAAIANNAKRPSLQAQHSAPVGRSSSAHITSGQVVSGSPANSRSISIDSAPAKTSAPASDRRISLPPAGLHTDFPPNSAPPVFTLPAPHPTAAVLVTPPFLPKPGMMLVPVTGIGANGVPTTVMVSVPMGGSITVHANGSTLYNQPTTPPSETRPTGPRERHNSTDSIQSNRSAATSPVASPTHAQKAATAHRNANSRELQAKKLSVNVAPAVQVDTSGGLDFDTIAARPSPSSKSRPRGHTSDGLSTDHLHLPPQSPHSSNHHHITPAEAAAMISPQLAEMASKVPPPVAKSPQGRKNFSIAHPIGEFDAAGKGESDETPEMDEDAKARTDDTLHVPAPSGRHSRKNSLDRDRRAHSMITTHSSKSPGSSTPASPKHSKKVSHPHRNSKHKDSGSGSEEDPQAAKERVLRKIAERDKRADAWAFSRSKTSTTLGFVKNCLVWKFVLRPRTSSLPAPITSPTAAGTVAASTSVAIARDEEHELELFHSIMGGKRTVKVDGAVVVSEKKLLDGGSRYTFDVGALAETHTPCILEITATGSEFQYEFIIDGVPWTEAREKFLGELNKDYADIYAKAHSLGVEVTPLGVAGFVDQLKNGATSNAAESPLAGRSSAVYGPVI